MMAALHTDQGRRLSIWISVGDIMWLSFSFPKTSSHAFTLSWGMLKTCPVGTRSEVSDANGGLIRSCRRIRGNVLKPDQLGIHFLSDGGGVGS